jgi:hypothetical protein
MLRRRWRAPVSEFEGTRACESDGHEALQLTACSKLADDALEDLLRTSERASFSSEPASARSTTRDLGRRQDRRRASSGPRQPVRPRARGRMRRVRRPTTRAVVVVRHHEQYRPPRPRASRLDSAWDDFNRRR